MPRVTQGLSHTDSSPPFINPASPETSKIYSSPTLQTHEWSHKKFGCRQRGKVLVADCPTLRRRHSTGPSMTLEPSRRLSPHKDEKKKKRRESDAKWRSNLSICFKHLEAKVLSPRNCKKSHLSKETIVQKTVRKVQYLEAVVMLLNQTDTCGKNAEFSPAMGHHYLQATKNEFAFKFHFRNRHKKFTVASPQQSATLIKNTAVENQEGEATYPDSVVPDHCKALPSHDQLVPPSAKTTADGAQHEKFTPTDRGTPRAMQTVPSITGREASITSTPAKSLICEEKDFFDDKSPRTPKFTSKNVILNHYSGSFPQSKVMMSSRNWPSQSSAQSPTCSPTISDRTFSRLSYCDPTCSPAKGKGSADRYGPPHWSPATYHNKASSNRTTLSWSPARSPAKSPAGRTVSISRARSPVRSDGNSVVYSPPVLSDFTLTSPSKRYKIVGGSVTSLGDAEPGIWESSSQADLDSSLEVTGRTTPDLMCQEEIPAWKEDDRSQKLSQYSTPHSVHPPSSKPPSVPPKKRVSGWSCKFVNSSWDAQPRVKSKRCKRLFWDDDDETGGREDWQLKKRKPNTAADNGNPKETKERRRYHKRATAARIRPWDPVASKVSSPVYGITKLKSKRMALPAVSKNTSHFGPIINSVSCSQDHSAQKMLPKMRQISHTGPRIITDTGSKKDLGAEDILDIEEVNSKKDRPAEDILDVEGVDFVDWPKECFSNTQTSEQLFPDQFSSLDQDIDSSQGSLLLQEIPQLPDDIIRPLLMGGETDNCFPGAGELGKTVQRPRCPTSDSESRLKLTKSDDEIVLTILELEEESRTSSSSRSSPDSTNDLFANPTSTTKKTEKDIVDVMEIMTPDQEGYQDQLQEALLEAYQLLSVDSVTGGGPSVILSPVRISRLGSFTEKSSPDKPSVFLLSPIKCKIKEVSQKPEKGGGREGLPEHDENKITESMARFASSALSNQTLSACYRDWQTLSACYRQPIQDDRASPGVLEIDCSDGEKAYSGATQALLNGQIIGKSGTGLKVNSYRPRSTLICVDSGTPTKNQPDLPYLMPVTVKESHSTRVDNPCTFLSVDTNVASHTSTSPYLLPLSSLSPSTPGGYRGLACLSQNTADASFSTELTEDTYRMSQESPSINKLADWEWSDPPAIDLEANESLDDLMGDDLLTKYYHTYDCLDSAGSITTDRKALTEVPEWNAETNVSSQPFQDDDDSSLSMATGSSSQVSIKTESLQSGEYQVVPSLSPDDDDAMARDHFGFPGVKQEICDSPEDNTQILQRWLTSH